MYRIDSFLLEGFQKIADLLAPVMSCYRIAAMFHCLILLLAMYITVFTPGWGVTRWLLIAWCVINAAALPFNIQDSIENEKRTGVIPIRREKERAFRLLTVLMLFIWMLPPQILNSKAWIIVNAAGLICYYFAACIYNVPPPKTYGREAYE